MTCKPFLFTLFFLAPPVVAWCQSAENPQKPSSYVVKKGDCLWNISKRVWGDPTKWPLLFATNEAQIKNPNLIYPGQRFKIPTTITKDELRKATELAQERAVPLPAAVTGAEGHTLKTAKKAELNTASNQPATSPSASKLSPSNPGTENKENAVSPSNPAAGTAEPTGGSSKFVVLIAALLALGGGLFIWFRKRRAGISLSAQQPRPLSSFPQSAEPSATKPVTTPPSTPSQAMPSQPPVTPAKPPVVSAPPTPATPPPAQPLTPSPATPSTPPAARTGEFTGTITSISMSQPPMPSKAEPGAPTTPSSVASTPPTPSASGDKPEDHPSDTSAGKPS